MQSLNNFNTGTQNPLLVKNNHCVRGKKIRHFILFSGVGGFGAGCYILFSYLATCAGLPPWVASPLVYTSLVPIIYSLQRCLVFHSTVPHRTSFPKYVAIQLLGIFLSLFLPYTFSHIALPATLSFFMVVGFIMVANYILQKRWAFQHHNTDRY